MNTTELLIALQDMGVDPNYSICGHVPQGGRMRGGGEVYVDRTPDGSWVVGIYERGHYEPRRHFESEDEACRYAYAMLALPILRRKRERGESTPEEDAMVEAYLREVVESARRQARENRPGA